MGHDAEILGVCDPDLGYDAEKVRISRPNGRLDRHVAQGYWEGYVETFPYTQELGHTRSLKRAPRRQVIGNQFTADWPLRVIAEGSARASPTTPHKGN